MAKEIERKFLVANDLWRIEVQRTVRLRDGLLAFSDGRKVRIRFYDDRATLTVKGRRKGISRDEFEYDIPSCDGLVLLADHCDGEVLEKSRHHIQFGGHEWIVDEYHGILAGMLLAEIEIPTECTQFMHPPWLGPEVTGKQKYRHTNLIKAYAQARSPQADG